MFERQWRPAEVMTALTDVGLHVKVFRELPTMFWDQFPNWTEAARARVLNSYLILAGAS